MQKPIYGIFIVEDKKNQARQIGFETWIVEYQKDMKGHFATTPAAQQVIRNNPHLIGRRIGEIIYGIESEKKSITRFWFYPIGGTDHITLPKITELEQTGISSFTRLVVHQLIEKKFPGYTIKTHGRITRSARRMLQRDHAHPFRETPISDAEKELREKVAKEMKLHRKSRPR